MVRRLATTTSDLACELAELADRMADVACDMGWVAQFTEPPLEEHRATTLKVHSAELLGAAGVARKWANALEKGE